jgi:hypothetical protein
MPLTALLNLALTALIFTKLANNGITWRSSTPNFTYIGQEMWKNKAKNRLRP